MANPLDLERHIGEARAGIAARDMWIERLEAALREALEFADEGWSYASDYFKEKWDYEGQRARIASNLEDK